MPLKVVIVEDNNATVRSLVQTIDWQALGCEIAGVAFDGESGKELILEKRPSIVLTDIKMPRKDGLEMIQEIRHYLPECKIIVITGYDQFEYANRAIKLSVFDYILKPIDNEEVKRSIHRAASDTLRQKETGIALAQAVEFKRRAQLISLLTNDSQIEHPVEEPLSDMKLDFQAYYLMVVQLLDESIYTQAKLNHLDTIIDRLGIKAITVLLYDSAVILVMRDSISKEWKEEVKGLSDTLSCELLASVHIGVSTIHTARSHIKRAYQQARQALREIVPRKHPQEMKFYLDDKPHQRSERITEIQRIVDELIEKTYLTDESAAEVAHILTQQNGQQYNNLHTIVTLYVLAMQKKFGIEQNEKVDTTLCELWSVSNEESTREFLIRLYTSIKEAREGNAGIKQSLLTRNALDYIHQHAIEGIQLTDLAEKLCFSANYLSALIRKETGKTFQKHVIEAKMNVARKMLSDPRVLVEEVAHAVGYGNYISFYQAFKRVENMTPTDYRNQMVDL